MDKQLSHTAVIIARMDNGGWKIARCDTAMDDQQVVPTTIFHLRFHNSIFVLALRRSQTAAAAIFNPLSSILAFFISLAAKC